MNRFHLAFAFAGLGFAPLAAHASIQSFNGQVVQIAPPANIVPFMSYSNIPDFASVWDEQQAVPVSNLAMDLVNNPGNSSAPLAGTVSGLVDSHYLHFRHTTFMPATGNVTFSGKIIGVAYDWQTLDPSDAPLGASGTSYFPGLGRGMSNWGLDYFAINNKTLTFSLVGDPGYFDTVQLRIVTEHVPAPGVCGVLGMTLLAAPRRRS